jgi:spermidine dehydrogenase
MGRQPFGRIHIANSDADGHAYTNIAIDQGYRAVREITVDAKHEAASAGA